MNDMDSIGRRGSGAVMTTTIACFCFTLAKCTGAAVVAATIALVAGVGLTSTGLGDDEKVIAPSVWRAYQSDYLSRKRPGAFAVSGDGRAYGYSYCPDYRCTLTKSPRQIALDYCYLNGGRNCYIFAVGEDIKVTYRIGSSAPGAGAQPKYGALAYSKSSNYFGTAVRKDSPNAARASALQSCGAEDCKVVAEFGPEGCVAYGLGTELGTHVTGKTESATKQAIDAKCGALPGGCYVRETLCN